MCNAPGPRENDRSSSSAAVGSSPPEPGMPTAPGPREGGRLVTAIAFPPREAGVRTALGPRVNDTIVVTVRGVFHDLIF